MSVVFLSGSDVQRGALMTIKQDMEELGFTVRANWLAAGDPKLLPGASVPLSGAAAQSADRWFDLMRADIIIAFDATPQCMIELGAAKALAHRIFAIGLSPDHDDAALFLPDVQHYTDWPQARREFFEKPKALRIMRRDKK